MAKIKLSYNANSRNKRKVINGFVGNGTSSDWVKTTDFGSYKHEYTADEIAHKEHIRQARLHNIGRHAGSKSDKQLLASIL